MSLITELAMENKSALKQQACADTSGSNAVLQTDNEPFSSILSSNPATTSPTELTHPGQVAAVAGAPPPSALDANITTPSTSTSTTTSSQQSVTPPTVPGVATTPVLAGVAAGGHPQTLLNGGGPPGGGVGHQTASSATPNNSASKHTVNPNMSSTNNTNNNTATNVKSCAGCGARIVDRFLLHAMDRYWHTGCLKCSCCQAQLGEIGTSCFTKAGMILCKNDYIRLFGSSGTCAACSNSIPAQEFVMRAQNNVYHVNCFTCVTCHQRLVPGDRYSIVNGSLICEQDYPKVLKGHTSIPMRPTHKVNNNNNNTNINNRNESEMLPYY